MQPTRIGQDTLARKNSLNRAMWHWRWHLNGGSPFWSAHDMADLRDDDALARYREIEQRRREAVRAS